MSKHKFNKPVQFYSVSNTNTAFGGTNGMAADPGSVVYDSLISALSVYNGSSWGELVNDIVGGKVITVDTNHPKATDTRTGLSRYTKNRPFKTIQAAINAADSGLLETIYIAPGQYNESVIGGNKNYNIIYDTVDHVGGTSSALDLQVNNTTVRIILINSTIRNTGNAASRETTAAINIPQVGQLYITGIGGVTKNNPVNNYELPQIVSTESYALSSSIVGGAILHLDNVTLRSTNHHAFTIVNTGNINVNINRCRLVSTNAAAVSDVSTFNAYDSIFIGSTYGIRMPNNTILGFNFFNCHIESTAGNAIGNGSLGSNPTRIAKIFDSTIISYNQALSFGTGNGTIHFWLQLFNVNITINHPAITNTVSFPNTGQTGQNIIRFQNVISNRSIDISNMTFNSPESVVYSNVLLNQKTVFENNGTSGNSSALVEFNSINKGIVLPKISDLEAITPATAMLVHATESYGTSGLTNADVYAYSNNSWQALTRHRIVEQFITGSTSIDLSLGNMFILTLTGNVTNFTFTNEVIGRQYVFIFLKDTTNKTLTFQAGKYRFPFGNAPTLTDPTTNGTTPATSRDVITAICTTQGRLDMVFTPDLINN
jgi:hypothetical protein